MSIPSPVGRRSLPAAIVKRLLADLPLTADILTRHADSDHTAIIDGERHLSYRRLNQAADNLPAACVVRIKPGETALVQLGNVAELYITFFVTQAGCRSGAGPVQPSA